MLPALIVETKTKTRSYPPTNGKIVPPGGGNSFEPGAKCEEVISWPEVHGAASPTVAARINRALENDRWIFGEEGIEEEIEGLRKCVVGQRMRASRGFEVMFNSKGIFAVREAQTAQYEGGIHSWDPGPERWLAFDTQTGEAFTWKALLVESKQAYEKVGKLLDRCVRGYVRDVNGGDPDALRDMLEKVSFDNPALLALPTRAGLHFAALGYAPPARVLEGNGPTITWSALVLSRALRTSGLAPRLVAGIAPAAPSDDPCAAPM